MFDKPLIEILHVLYHAMRHSVQFGELIGEFGSAGYHDGLGRNKSIFLLFFGWVVPSHPVKHEVGLLRPLLNLVLGNE